MCVAFTPHYLRGRFLNSLVYTGMKPFSFPGKNALIGCYFNYNLEMCCYLVITEWKWIGLSMYDAFHSGQGLVRPCSIYISFLFVFPSWLLCNFNQLFEAFFFSQVTFTSIGSWHSIGWMWTFLASSLIEVLIEWDLVVLLLIHTSFWPVDCPPILFVQFFISFSNLHCSDGWTISSQSSSFLLDFSSDCGYDVCWTTPPVTVLHAVFTNSTLHGSFSEWLSAWHV